MRWRALEWLHRLGDALGQASMIGMLAIPMLPMMAVNATAAPFAQGAPPADAAWFKAIVGPYGAMALLLLLGGLVYRGGLRSGRDVAEMRADYEKRLENQKADHEQVLKDQRTDYEQRLADARRDVEWWRQAAVDALGAGEKLATARRAMEDKDHGF